MAYEYFYPGTPSNLDPEYGDIFTGYRIPAAQIGASTSVQTANQVKEVTNLLNQGIKAVEVSSISPEVFEMIPKQHLKEINRLSKLTGSETSLHAPIIDPSGFTQQGWDETNRESAERQFSGIVERSHELSPQGNIPVTIHASAVPGTEHIEWKNPKTGNIEEVPQRMIAVNQETGELIPLAREKMFYPETGEKLQTAESRLRMVNDSHWINKITNLAFYKKEADEILLPAFEEIGPLIEKEKLTQEDLKKMQEHTGAVERLDRAHLFLDNVETTFRNIYNEAYKYGNDDVKKVLGDISEKWKQNQKNMQKVMKENPFRIPILKSELIDYTFQKLKEIEHAPPQLYKPVEDFVQDKASSTLGSVAFNAYKKFGDTAPIVSIENPPYGSAVSRAEDLKKLVEETRKKFVEKAKLNGISESEATDAAEKLIGVTWDTSHISMLRKQGFKGEKLIEEARKIAPFVKHVHLNDNFGSTHTDLPPGMGSAPIKEIMTELEKAKFKGKKIFEGGQFFQHFQTSPHPYVLEALGSPLYGMVAQPYWNQITASYGNYFSFPSAYFPEQHFSMYGSGFSSLPQELGGQIPGKQSRVTGTPNA